MGDDKGGVVVMLLLLLLLEVLLLLVLLAILGVLLLLLLLGVTRLCRPLVVVVWGLGLICKLHHLLGVVGPSKLRLRLLWVHPGLVRAGGLVWCTIHLLLLLRVARHCGGRGGLGLEGEQLWGCCGLGRGCGCGFHVDLGM